MYPNLPLTLASIRDLCQSTDFLMTELEYADKTYLHNQSTTYTVDGESLILVDTTQPRTVRLAQTPNIKRSLVIKDITGNAEANPILITIAENTAGTVTLQGQTGREFQMFAPFGAVELTGYQNQWTVTVPRSTCISNRGFRLPQNLNLALPPAVGAVRQHFPAMVFFPATMEGVDVVPSNYNGLAASVMYADQISVADDTASLTPLFIQPLPPPRDPSTFSERSIVTDVVWNIPSDFPSLPAAFQYLDDKEILPGASVTLTVNVDNITGLLNFNHPNGERIIIQGQEPIQFEPESTSVFQTIPGAILVDVTMTPAELAQAPVGSYLVIDQVVSWPLPGTPGYIDPNQPGDLRRWTGVWPVVDHTTTADGRNARIQISDWGPNFPTTPMVPKQCRWRMLPSVINVAGAGELLITSDGYTLDNIAIVGASNAVNGLVVRGLVNLSQVTVTGFTQYGIYGSYRAIIATSDVFSCGNGYGIYLERQATLAGDVNPSDTVLCVNGNSTYGLWVFSNAEANVNPLFACGNQLYGLIAQTQATVELFNSYLNSNGTTGLFSGQEALVSGSSNAILKNGTYDVAVGNGGTINLTLTSANNTNYDNGTLNADGSRINISTT